jgi:protein gp37
VTENTKIEWADHTFNPWWGCTEVSPGCDHCYARTWAKRYGLDVWGKGVARRTFGPKHWVEPLKWNAAAEREGVRRRVFCASMADLGDVAAPAGELARLFALIRLTPWLDWLLLTKRPQELARRLPEDWGKKGYENVWLGTSVESQEYVWRLEALLKIKARVRFVSAEPLLGPVLLDDEITSYLTCRGNEDTSDGAGCFAFESYGKHFKGIDWVIVGGESGAGARPCDLGWVRSIVGQCQAAAVPVFVKQLGTKPYRRGFTLDPVGDSEPHTAMLKLKDAKGGDPGEWPEDLRVREFPR